MDADGYKIVNVDKHPPTRLQSLDLPMFPHPCLSAGDFNCRHVDWGYDDNSADSECLDGWASVKAKMPRMPPVFNLVAENWH